VHRSRALIAALASLGLLAAACGGGPPPTSAPTPTSPAATASPSPPPVTPLPAAVLDPSMTAVELFDDSVPANELGLTERSRENRDAAVIRDVTYTGADSSPVPAFLVQPATGAPRAGVLFLHWLGDDFSSRDEFVDEAVALAGQGVESMLITQHFPWSERPLGVDHDRVAIGLQVRTIRRGLTLLAGEVGAAKIAIVGHDYGAMYGILAASVDPRLGALVAMAPDSTWVNWFVTYFHVVGTSDAPGYAQAMADLDPVTRIAEVQVPILLQFGTADVYVSGEVAHALGAAAPGGTLSHSYDADHRLDLAARSDRDAWLLQELGLPAPAASP